MYNLNSGFGLLKAIALAAAHRAIGGKVFVVAGTSNTSYNKLRAMFSKGDPDGVATFFFTTIDAAVSACTASRDDLVLVAPYHTETISSATALSLDVAGVSVVGMGVGTQRPVITLDTATTTTIPVSAADITVKNIVFSANFADIVSVFTLTTAKNFRLESCYVKATATNMNFKSIIDTNATANDADGLTLVDNTWIEPDLATLYAVKMDGTNDRVTISGNYLNLGVNNNTASIMAIATTKIVTNLVCTENMVYRLNTDTATGGLFITTDVSTNTGIIAKNFGQHADTAAEILVTASSGFGFFENRASGVAGATGYVLPAADS